MDTDLDKKTAEQNAPLSFSEQVDASLNGTLPFYTSLKVCDTPQILLDVGCKQLPMLYTQKHLKDAISPKDNKNIHKHGLDIEQIKQLPDLLQNPIMVYDSLSRNDSIVLVTTKYDNDNLPIIATVKPNGNGRYDVDTIDANFITSVHGRDNFFNQFICAVEQDKMLFCDKKHSQELFERWGLQLPELTNTLDYNCIIHQSRNIVNTQNQNSEKNKEEIPLTNEELLKILADQLGKNNDLVGQLIAQINILEKKVQDVTDKQEMFVEHFNQIYNAKSMEETLGIMSNLGKLDMEVQSCDVYSYDALENKLFTVDENGKRIYTDISENTPISSALLKNEVFIDNNYTGDKIGDSRDSDKVKNVAVIPIESKTGEVIGVVVAKNKETEFNKDDVDKFNLKNGKIGSAFRMGLENKALKQAAITDKLTHLRNRQGLEEDLKKDVLPQIHEGKPVSTLMIDIDKFKLVNDIHGHAAGDITLQTVSEILKTKADNVYRWGGEEMLVIANMNANEAYELAEQIRKTIENTPFDIGDGKTIQVTVSIGVAQLMTEHPQQLNANNIMDYFKKKPLQRADERLYEAKENGRNQVVAPPAVMKAQQQQQDRRKSSVIGTIKSVKDEEQSRPKQPKDQNRNQPKKNNHDLS